MRPGAGVTFLGTGAGVKKVTPITSGLWLLHGINQWFSTFSLKGAKSRPTIL